MWELSDIFKGDPFTAITLTASINNVPFTPQLLGSIGLYAADGVRTVDIAIEQVNGALSVIQTSPRGSAPEQQDNEKRNWRKATAVHFARERSVNADEVQGAIAGGMINGQPPLQTAESLINDRLNGPFGLRAAAELTHEYHRLGGIKGIVVDKDGAELFNWFDFFGIAALADHNTNFGALTATDGTFETECTQLKRDMMKELNGLPIAQLQPIVFCGDNYFDQVYSNKEVKADRRTRDTGRDADVFSQNKAFSNIVFGGINFVNYRGTDDGVVGIDADEGRLFPYGVPGLFQMLFAPADIMGLTNEKGLPVFAFMPPERQTSRQAVVEAQSNPLTFCARPRALRRLTKS